MMREELAREWVVPGRESREARTGLAGTALPAQSDTQVPATPELLWSRQAPRLVRAALALGVPPEEAADVVQETLIAAFRARHRFDPSRASFDGWIHAILVRRCSNWRRARRRWIRAVTGLGRIHQESQPSPERVVQARQVLERSLARLSPMRRKVWTLLEVSGLSPAEAAAALEISEATVRSHLRHARNSLNEAVGEES